MNHKTNVKPGPKTIKNVNFNIGHEEKKPQYNCFIETPYTLMYPCPFDTLYTYIEMTKETTIK